MMRIFSLLLLTMLTILSPLAAGAEDQRPTPLGLWLTENERSVVEVHPCSANTTKLCGRIHWIIEGGMQFDEKNPDVTARKNPMCGLQIMSNFHQHDTMNWIDGRIYKADEGDTYNATMQMLPTGKMIVRGYIGMPLFGKSQTWTRVTGGQHKKCRP